MSKFALFITLWLAFFSTNHLVRSEDDLETTHWDATFSPPDHIHVEVTGNPGQLCLDNDHGLTRHPVKSITIRLDHPGLVPDGKNSDIPGSCTFPDPCIFDIPTSKFELNGENYEVELHLGKTCINPSAKFSFDRNTNIVTQD